VSEGGTVSRRGYPAARRLAGRLLRGNMLRSQTLGGTFTMRRATIASTVPRAGRS
jgi:hypothetical protein